MPRSSRRRRAVVPALACALTLLLGSCSDGSDNRNKHNDLGACDAPATASPSPAAKAKSGSRRAPNRDDFDGDGRRDLFLNGWYKKRGERWKPNRALLLGAAGGVAAGRQVSLTDRLPAIDGKMIGNPEFQGTGVSTLTGDLDGDGCADIIFVSVRTNRDGRPLGYNERIVWGGKGGVDGTSHRLPEARAPHFAAGDFDGDGALDLISGAYRATADKKNKVRCARLEFGPFDRNGRPKERHTVDITQGGRVYTHSLTVGDFDGDGRDEFVTTGAREGKTTDLGWPEVFAVASYYRVGTDRTTVRAGALKGLGDGKRLQYDLEGDEPEYNADPYPSEQLSSMPTADFGGNGRVDLVQTDEILRTKRVVYGGPSGPGTGHPATRLPELGDNSSTGDVNGDGRDDLITAFYRSRENQVGTVAVHPGGPDGLSHDEPKYTFDRTDVGMPGSPHGDFERDNFGTGLNLADLNGDGADELTVTTQDYLAAPYEGVYWEVPGSREGPVPKKAVRMDVGSVGRR